VAREAELAHEAAMGALRETIEAGRAREASLVGTLHDCRVELASAAERADALRRELARLDQIEADLVARVEQARQRQTQTAERSAWLAEERERTDALAREVAVERDRIEEDARAAGVSHQELAGQLQEIEREVRSVEAELRTITSAVHERELKLT
jgi:chromosome segregation ATPase